MTPKGVINTITNTAMMTAFAIPGGAPVGAGLAILGGLFQIFMPDAAVPPALQGATQSDINDAVTQLKSAIAQDLFNSSLDAATRKILTRNQGLVEKIGEMKKQGVDRTHWVFPSDNTSQNWLNGTVVYFTTPTGVLTDLRDARDVLTFSSKNDDALTYAQRLEHRTKTTALYCLATSAIVLYLKTATSWEWVLETLYSMAYPQWYAADKAWGQKSAAYQKLHPEEDPANIFPADVPKMSGGLLDWQDWIAKRATAADLMIIELNDMVTYAIQDSASGNDGLFTSMNKNWAARNTQFDNAVVNAFQFSSGSATPQVLSQFSNAGDCQLGLIGGACPACIDLQNEVIRGSVGLDQWETDTTRYGFDGVSADDLAQFHDTISVWQDALETLQFQTLTANPGDTPGSLAQHYYGDDTLWDKLLDTSEKAFGSKTLDLSGVRVKVPYREGQKVPLAGLDMKRVDLPALPSRLV